jgi:hypothetical protein
MAAVPTTDVERSSIAYRSAVVVAPVASVLLVWLSLGFGIIGKDGLPWSGPSVRRAA